MGSHRDSGVNLRNAIVGETYDGMYTGTKTVAEMQEPLTFDEPDYPPVEAPYKRIPCWQVLVQADPDNITNVLVGDEVHGCHIVLVPGANITIRINEVSKIWIRSEAAVMTTVHWMALI
jgi:hypothetical protein